LGGKLVRDAEERVPLSLEQRDYLGLGRTGYGTIAACSRVTGPLRVDALTDAVAEVISRHEPLRMRLRYDDDDVSQVFLSPPQVPTGWTVQPLSGHAELDRYLAADLDRARDGALRLMVLADTEERAYVLVLADHLACDGWGSQLFLRELWLAYRSIADGRAPELPSLTRTYSDFVRAQQALARRSKASHGYWEAMAGRFAGSATGLARPCGAAEDGAGRADLKIVVPRHTIEQVRALARVLSVSPNTLPIGSLVLAASSMAEADSVGISFAYAGRDLPGVQQLIGVFHRRVPLLVERIAAGDLGQFLTGLAGTTFDAIRRSRAPYSAAEFDSAVGAGRAEPAVDVLYNQIPAVFGSPGHGESLPVQSGTVIDFPKVHFRPVRWRSYREPRLRIVAGGGEQPVLQLIFNQGLVAADEARRLADRMVAILGAMSPDLAHCPVPRFVQSAIGAERL
jgi:hypothetical protein